MLGKYFKLHSQADSSYIVLEVRPLSYYFDQLYGSWVRYPVLPKKIDERQEKRKEKRKRKKTRKNVLVFKTVVLVPQKGRYADNGD